jgi:hypothetical protein
MTLSLSLCLSHTHTHTCTGMVGHTVSAAQKKTYRSNKCVLDVRNSGTVAHLVLKFIDNILHVYSKNNQNQNSKYRCACVFMCVSVCSGCKCRH